MNIHKVVLDEGAKRAAHRRKMLGNKTLLALISDEGPDELRRVISGRRGKALRNSSHVNWLSGGTHHDVPFAAAAVETRPGCLRPLDRAIQTGTERSVLHAE